MIVTEHLKTKVSAEATMCQMVIIPLKAGTMDGVITIPTLMVTAEVIIIQIIIQQQTVQAECKDTIKARTKKSVQERF